MNILIASPEVVPFAKTGGLADVAGALPKAVSKLGNHKVAVVLPKYKMIDEKKFNLKVINENLKIGFDSKEMPVRIFYGEIDGSIPVYFVDSPEYYAREGLYQKENKDYPDNAERFAFFAKAALEVCKTLNFKPDVIHCHDWQAALIPVLLKGFCQQDSFFKNTATVFTIHNIGYQGNFPPEKVSFIKFPDEFYTMRGLEFYGNINFLKGGLVFSEIINTVSRKYSLEIQTPEYGCGLEGVLKERSKDLYGIINGIDYEEWSPEKDKLIKYNFSRDDLSGKAFCKKELQRELGLKQDMKVPVIGVISRIAEQKGLDLIAEVFDTMMQMDLQFVLLGSGEKELEEFFQKAFKKYSGRFGVKIGFDNGLAHSIEAGSDMFLMPSRYEPCGLNQIYSIRYGTVPIVRATGGLDDTITDFEEDKEKGNGFKFEEASAQQMLRRIKTALKYYNSRDWMKIVENGMKADFSWDASARKYVELYGLAVRKKRDL
ncbi:MAG: starch synthase [Candidatus Schekmanbacteria bacterium RBG_16_38_10]|uniref:Glycogen synthase n=1 Tax=Candidatus Schekmanbacteria bacterium RBG_16_38_10 TaxID=1817879 RepID=A0A1F7RXZ5_9BACT|nr:MAG: starch synthase [Candidatus Schekmanbacteria bacterium RBG_16_38_10]